VTVTVVISGTPSGAVTVTDDDDTVIPSGETTFTLTGYYSSSEAGTTVTRTVSLEDSAGNTTSCSFSLYIE
jgi:hypothetical protein